VFFSLGFVLGAHGALADSKLGAGQVWAATVDQAGLSRAGQGFVFASSAMVSR
jgi:hypothetical protein